MIAVAAMLVVGGCGREKHSPDTDQLPVATGLRIAVSLETCAVVPDVCRREVLIEGRPGVTGSAMLQAERQKLTEEGWKPVPAIPGDVGLESSDKHVDAFMSTSWRYLRGERKHDDLRQALRYPDLRPLPARLLANERRGRSGLVVILELP